MTLEIAWRGSRSSHWSGSVKKGALRNFTKFTGKLLCQRLFFNNVATLRPATLLKTNLWHNCFPVNFSKFLKTPFLQNTSRRLTASRAQLHINCPSKFKNFVLQNPYHWLLLHNQHIHLLLIFNL